MTAKRFWLSACLGLGIVGVTLIGFHWHFGQNPGANDSGSVTTAGLDPATYAGVVCYGYVDLEQGCTSLNPSQPGRVERILVRENDSVAAGAPLLSLDDQAARLTVEEARSAIHAAQIQLAQAQNAPARYRVRLARQRAAILAAQKRLAAAGHLLKHKQDLEKRDLAAGIEVQAEEEQVKQLQALAEVEAETLADLELQDPQWEVRRADTEVALAQAKLRQAEHVVKECTLRAPQAGRVLRIMATPGEMASPQSRQPALLFAPDGPRLIRAEVEQEFAGRLAVGQAVRVQDDVDARLRFGGRVTRISDWYLQRRSIFQEPTRFNDTRTLECLIRPDPGYPPLRIGQRVLVVFDAGR